MAKLNSIDDFLNHRGAGGTGGQYLKSWKQRPGTIDVFLHTKRIPQPLWAHAWHKIEPRTDKNTQKQTKEVWSDRFVCHEPEAVLKEQYKRDQDTGERETPPIHCPFCRFTDHIRMLVRTRKLEWKEPIFRFTGDGDPDRNVVIHAAGIYGGYAKVEKGTKEAEELKSAGIYLNKVWAEKAEAKLHYVMAIVNANNPSDGVQIAVEPGLLGQKIQTVISKQREALQDKGNPFIHPYAIRWKAMPDAKKIDDKYDALPLPALPLTSQIAKLIRSNPPDISSLLKPGNITSLRARLEQQATPALRKLMKEADWDEIFKVVPVEEEDESLEFPTDGGEVHTREPGDDSDEDDAAVDEDSICEDCKAPMEPSDTKCKNCGTVYEVTDEVTPEPEPEKPVRRIAPAQTAARTVVATTKVQVTSTKAAVEDDDGDDIPFDKPQQVRRAKR